MVLFNTKACFNMPLFDGDYRDLVEVRSMTHTEAAKHNNLLKCKVVYGAVVPNTRPDLGTG